MTSPGAAPTTLLGLFDSAPAESTAIILPEQNIRVTYGALRRQVETLADALAGAGIRRGDRVGMALPNGLPTIVSFLAASMAGTAAPLNPGYKEDEFRFYLEDTGARVLLLPPDGADEARRAAGDRVPILPVEMDAAGTVTIGGATGSGTAEAPNVDDVALILHTSGSTGRPKLIVSGATRDEALARSRRALAEFNVEGLATVIPFHRAVVSDPAFIGDGDGFDVHTRWIETEWDNAVEPFTGGDPIEEEDTIPRQTVVVEIGGRRVEVSLPGDLAIGSGGVSGVVRKKPKPRKRGAQGGAAASGDAVTAPMQGTVVKVAVEEGQQVAAGDLIAVLEAMKMENPVTAHKDGTITGLAVEAGAAVTQGTVLAEIK